MGISFSTENPSSSGGIISAAPPFQGTSNGSGVALGGVTEDLLWEVLVRLPTKSLMRFKCVSKLWHWIILDPKFVKAHAIHAAKCGGFLFNFGYNRYGLKFFHANLGSPSSMHHHFTIDQPNYYNVTQVTNGLIGFFSNDASNFMLCNIATRELLNLPPSPPTSRVWHGYHYTYYIGFDPVKEVYKVLNFTLYYDFDGDNGVAAQGIDYHVFTLGVGNSDMEWRNIDPPSSNINFVQCLCTNGVMYWMSCDQQTLEALHLNCETFETIDLSPECTGGVNLVEICGRIALVAFSYSQQIAESFDVWTMNTHRGGGDLEAWTRKRILLPNSLNCAFTSWNYVGTLPTGEMMLALATGEGELDNVKLPIFIYDHHKNELSNLVTIDDYGYDETRMAYHLIMICYYEDNIISLDCLIKNEPQDQKI